MNLAFPLNRSDPLLRDWKKSTLNPVANQSSDAPSTAWQTTAGEWRLLSGGHRVWSSEDFGSWRYVGNLSGVGGSGVGGGLCLSLFPAPPLTPGVDGMLPDGATYVYKSSVATPVFHDTFTLGSYSAGQPGTAGEWSSIGYSACHVHSACARLFSSIGCRSIPNTNKLMAAWDSCTHRCSVGEAETIDGGQLFAGKDFWDPVHKRRIYWAWAHDVLPASALTLPRVITWHPQLQQFHYAPLPELDMLRGVQLTSSGPVKLKSENAIWLSKGWAQVGVGNQTEVVVTFAMPMQAARLGVVVMSAHTESDTAPTDGTMFYVDYARPDDKFSGAAWTVSAGAIEVDSSDVDDSSGGNLTGPPPFWPPYTTELKLLPTDTNVTLSIYVDNTLAECFFAGGRAVLTRSVGKFGKTLPAGTDTLIQVWSSRLTAMIAAGMAVVVNSTASSALMVLSAQVWQMSTIWLTPEQLLEDINQSH